MFNRFNAQSAIRRLLVPGNKYIVWDTLVEDGLYEVRYESLYDPGFHTGLFRFDFHPSRDTPRLVEEIGDEPLIIEKFYDQFVVLAARRCE